jgi:rhodanese-related sulfurtransferase
MSSITVKTAAQLVSEAKQMVEPLTPDQVAAELAGGKALVVDLREPEERATQGAIPGAAHAPRGMLEFYADPSSPYHRPEFDPARRVVLYCAAGSRSALGAGTLRQLGYGDVAHLDGGMKAWTQSGHPVDRVAAQP